MNDWNVFFFTSYCRNYASQ